MATKKPTTSKEALAQAKATAAKSKALADQVSRDLWNLTQEMGITPPAGLKPPPQPTPQQKALTDADVAAAVAKALAERDKDAATKAAAEKAEREAELREMKRENVRSALDALTDMFKGNGLAGLADAVDRMVREDKTVAEIKAGIRQTQEYKDRFPGMSALSAKGRAISEGDYIALERQYAQVMRSYGLPDEYHGAKEGKANRLLSSLIENEVSARELEERVQLGKDRLEANPEVLQQLRQFYPEIDAGTALGYVLDPTRGMDVVRKRVRQAEVGAALGKARFGVNAETADAYGRAVGDNMSYQELSQRADMARSLANQQDRLARIEGDQYQETEALDVVLKRDQQAGLRSQKRADREKARFDGTSGLGASSLRRNTSGSI
jgi:hypothetical protein